MINEQFPDFHRQPGGKRASTFQANQLSILPEISIITPFFNPKQVFEQTTNAVLNQSFQNFEWIIVNDNSTDKESLELLNALDSFDSRIRVITNTTNQGPSTSRNIGISNAKGHYLFFIDADDLIEPTAIEKYYLVLAKYQQYDFVNSWSLGFAEQEYFWKGGFEKPELFLDENRVTTCFMARRGVFQYLRFDPSITGGFEDWDFWLNALSQNKRGFTIKEYLFWYRRNNHSEKWHTWDNGKKQESFKVYVKQKYQNKIEDSSEINKDLDSFYKLEKAVSNKKINNTNKLKKKNAQVFIILPWLNMGGADKFNLDAIEGLQQKGWGISIATTLASDNEWAPLFSKITCDIFFLPNISGFNHYHEILTYLISSRQPDIILISNSMYGYHTLPYLKNQFPSIPFVDYIHSEDLDWMNGGYPRINTLYAEYLDRTIVSSEQLKNYILSLSYKRYEECPIDVCYTNIDPEKVKQNIVIRGKLRQEWHIPDNFKIIIYPVRFVQQKQPFVFANTIKELRKTNDNFICLAIGDGPLFKDFKQYLNQNELEDKIWCLGSKTNAEVLEYMDSSDIFFLPSLYEGIALSIYEAMAKGLVVVGAQVGGQTELVTKKTGYLIKRSDPATETKEYVAILKHLLTNSELQKSLQLEARKRIETQFTIDKMYEKLNSILHATMTQTDSAKESTIDPNTYVQLIQHLMHTELMSHKIWNELSNFRKQSAKEGDTNTFTINNEMLWYKNQIDTIKDWYRNEYEVLPLWYKRFGHIIKVVKGKRSVTSLFTDSRKKG